MVKEPSASVYNREKGARRKKTEEMDYVDALKLVRLLDSC